MTNQNNSSTDACMKFDLEEKDVCNYLVLPALCLVIALSFLGKRKRLHRGKCDGRPYVLSPVDFLEEDRRNTWVYLACFVLFTKHIQSLLNNELFWKPAVFHDPHWMEKYGWVQVFVIILNIAQICILFYPLMASIKLHEHLLASLIGMGYLMLFIWRLIAGIIACPAWKHHGSNDVIKYDEEMKHIILTVPRAISIIALFAAYSVDLFINIRNAIRNHKRKLLGPDGNHHTALIEESEVLPDPHYVQYVKQLLKTQQQIRSRTFMEKMKDHFIYKNIQGLSVVENSKRTIDIYNDFYSGFRYSPRLICTVVVSALILVVVSSIDIVAVHGIENIISSILTGNITVVGEIYTTVIASTYVGNYTSLILHLIFLARTVVCYRENMLKFYKGDRSWYHQRRFSPMLVVAQSMKFPGFQIAYMIYGYILVYLVVFGVSLFLAFGLILPLKHGDSSLIGRLIVQNWPYIAISVVIYVFQLIVARYVFLQNQKYSVALNNRRIYNVVSYFMFFYNTILGFFSGFKRILYSNIFSMLLMSRVDRCLVIRGLEFLDPGFNAYIGLLQFEEQHSHPVMRTFVYLLMKSVHEKRQRQKLDDSYDSGGPNTHRNMQDVTSCRESRSTIYRNKWFKAVTLIKNSSIINITEDTGCDELQASQKRHIAEVVIDSIGSCTSGIACLCCTQTSIDMLHQ